MLTIRSEQFPVLAGDQIRRFRDDLRRHLMRWFRGECEAIGEGGVAELIDRSVANARRLGLRSERALTLYASLAILHGPELGYTDETRWMRDYLEDPEVSEPEERLGRLYGRLLFEEQRVAANARALEAYERAGE